MPPTNKNNPDSQLPQTLRYRSLDRRGQVGSVPSSAPTPPPDPQKRPKLRFLDHRERWNSLSKKHKIIVTLAAVLVVVFGVLIARNLLGGSSSPAIDISKNQKKITTVASPLTGMQVAPELAKRTVTAIMIENSPDARPQSGIQDAGVIFEAIAEGGITRFLTLYQESRPTYIGPVRSLRPYYIDWASSFDAPIAHIGGSSDALSQIRSGGKDLDQFFNANSYWRESSRPAPHNVYTNFDKLDALNSAKGYTSSKFTSWIRKSDKALAVPTAKTLNINVSSSLYNVHYDYDSTSNSYLRSEGGAPHKAVTSPADVTGQQLHPKVVIALIMSYGIASDGQHSVYNTYGSGIAYVFQDGGVTQGTWSKADRPGQFSFVDANNVPIKLDTGQTWVSVISGPEKVSYAP